MFHILCQVLGYKWDILQNNIAGSMEVQKLIIYVLFSITKEVMNSKIYNPE